MYGWIIAFCRTTFSSIKDFKNFTDVNRTSKIFILKKVRSNTPVAYHLLILYPQNTLFKVKF